MTQSPRLLRLFQRIACRSFDYSSFRSAASRSEVCSLAVSKPLHLFNGNALRAKIAQAVIEKSQCGYFVETGTSHAATTIGAYRYFGLPVWSCENNRKDYFISRIVTYGMEGVTLFNLDSREFLRRTIADMKRLKAIPFFYLDAHEGELDVESLPLLDEVRLIMELETFVVMIDDFRVPGTDSFHWGSYGGKEIDFRLIKNLLIEGGITTCYFPSYEPDEETGYKSGYCIFRRLKERHASIDVSVFPFDLLKPYQVT